MNEIKISVDINVNLSESTQNFLTSILSGAHAPALPENTETNEPEKPEEEPKPAHKPRTRKPKEEPAPEEEPAKEEPEAEPAKEEPEAEPAKEEKPAEEPAKEEPAKEEPKAEPTKEEPKVDLETLRAKFKTAATSQENRAKLRDQLTKLGSSNLTNLDPSKYDEMNKFIESL